ncbi:MAG: hypothetical protein Q9160_008972 [Pyrenula sp. 1 TL-2023]
MEERYSYTPFSSLSSFRPEAIPHTSPTFYRRFSLPLASIEVLTLLWAELVGADAGSSDVVFDLDGQPILVDLKASKWTEVIVDTTLHQTPSATALGIKKPAQADKWTLLLQYDESLETATLSSAVSQAENVLEDLENRLMSRFWQRGSHGNEPDLKDYTYNKPALSVVNPYPELIHGPSFLHQLIDFQQNASKLAIDYLGPNQMKRRLTYREVDGLSSKLSTQIVDTLGNVQAKRDTVIPFMIPQCPELYITCLAILKAGYAFCPLNLDAPAERVKLIIDDVGAKVLLTVKSLERQLKPIGEAVKILAVDESVHEPSSRRVSSRPATDPEKLAYVMYTSGSSGTPKGVGISHKAATQALLAHEEHVPHFKRFLQFAAPTFDVSVFDSFFPLVRGATLVCCAREVMLGDLVFAMNTMEVDAAELTPTVASTLLRKRDYVPSLRVLLTIGEMLTRNVIEEFGHTGDEDGILHGMYGPTEATIHCTIAPEFNRNLRVGVIGVPLSTVSAFVLSVPNETASATDVSILPQGAVGELAVGGYQLANEYINRLEQTKAAFVYLEGYGRVYRTGDKARLNADGLLECLGRISDGQVKLRGQRVELGEIENVAYKVGGISHAMSSVLNGVLVLFCLVENDHVSEDDIKELYKQWLPGFMRPNEIVLLGDAPRLSSGKLDRKAIERNHKTTQSNLRNTKDDFASDSERGIAGILEEELGVQLTRRESLAARGLDSLRAIKVASRLRSYYVSISVADLLAGDSIAEIAKHRRDKASDSFEPPEANSMDSIERQIQQASSRVLADPNVDEVVPCSPLQLAMLSETARSPSTNVNKIELRFLQPITFLDFKTAFRKFASTNNMLRSGFVPADISTQPFIRVVWRDLNESQFHSTVPDDTHLRKIRSSFSLSHPLEFFFGAATFRIVILIHHALYDQWSWDILMNDLRDILSGQPLIQRPQFDSVAKYFVTFPHRHECHRAEEHWEEQLHNASVSSFPCLHHLKGSAQGTASVSRELCLTTTQLDNVSQGLRISRPSLISAAYGFLLSAYLGSPDIIYGTVSSGRSLPIDGIEQIFGPCISTLPLRVDVSDLRSARDLMTVIHHRSRDLLRHGELGLHRIQQLANAGGRQLFDTLFVWQESVFTNTTQNAVATVADSTDFLDFALLIEVEPIGDKLKTKVTFAKSILPTNQAEMFLSQLDQIVTVFSSSPDINLGQVYDGLPGRLLSIENSQNQKSSRSDLKPTESNGTYITANATLNKQKFNKKSVETWSVYLEEPQRTAIEFVSDFEVQSQRTRVVKLSYQQLDNNAISTARLLVERGVEQGDLVGILMEKSAELYVSIIAVLKAGAGYFPIDPKHPSERICYVFSEANVKCILVAPSLHAKLDQMSIRPTILHTKLDLSVKGSRGLAKAVDLPSHVDPKHPAYAISTSGTTGVPKTVLVSRRNVLANLEVLSRIYPYTSRSKYLQSCSHSFDVSVFDILFAFRNGLCLCSATNDVLFRDMGGLIRALKVTHLSMTNSVAAMIEPSQVPSVLCLITAGEALSSKVLNAWAGRGLYQGYGPSEATNICALRQNIQPNDFPNNIGYALPSTSLYISGSGGFMPIPRGAVGELCVGGDQVFQGYIKRPQLMTQKVVDHPHWGLIYRTGDMVRVLTDGSFCFLGREDDQLKLRGQRIELREIDNTILDIAGIENCTTLALRNQSNELSKLVSFCILENKNEKQGMASYIFEVLSDKLPTYMIPTGLIFLESMPIMGTGKIDRKALRAYFEASASSPGLVFSQGDTTNNVENFLTDAERSVSELVAQVTGTATSSLPRKMSLLRAGLDSINSVLLSRKLRERFSVQIDISTILTNPSIDRLANLIESEQKDGLKTSKLSNIVSKRPLNDQPSDITSIFNLDFQQSIRRSLSSFGLEAGEIIPCTPLQESMLSKLDRSQNASYQNTITFDVFIEEEDLRLGWSKALERHRVLRTGFVPTNDPRFAFAQVILKNFNLPWHTTHPSSPSLHESSRDLHMDNLSSDFIQPPYTLTYHRRTKARRRSELILNMHHALYDAEAMSVILSDVQSLALQRPGISTVPFDAYIQYMIDLSLADVDVFWQDHLRNLKPCRILEIGKHGSLDELSRSPQSIQHKSKMPLSDIEAAARKVGVTNLCIYQAAWAQLLSIATDSLDVCFGNVYNGRNLPIDGALTITGPCFNTLPLRARLRHNITNAELAQQLHVFNLEVLPFQPSSLRRIQSQLSQGQPLFDTLLLVQSEELSLNGQVWDIKSETGTMDFPIICEIMPNRVHNLLTMNLHWYGNLLSASEVTHFHQSFDEILHSIILYPSSLVTTSHHFLTKPPQIFDHLHQRKEEKAHEQSDQTSAKERSIDHDQWSEEDSIACGIISGLAGVQASKTSRSTTIFGLGLDSINAFQIAAALEKDGYHLSAADLLEAASIAQIGQLMRQNPKKLAKIETFDFRGFENGHLRQIAHDLNVETDQIDAVRPCTPTQCGILSHFIQSEGKLYCNETSWLLHPHLDVPKLEWAWGEAMARHEMLRTGFLQLEDPNYPFAMITYNLRSLQLPWYTSKSDPPVPDQLHVPPWRLKLRHEGNNTSLTLTMLHALYDATSLQSILSDVTAAYEGQKLRVPPSILPAIASFLIGNSDESEDTRKFWRRYAEGFQAARFPNLRMDALRKTTFGSVSRICSPSHSALAKSCQKLGISLQVAGQCAWARLLSAFIGEARIAFGLVLSGRSADETEKGPVVFPCVNTLPLGFEVKGSNRAIMQKLSDLTISLMKRQNTALSQIKKFTQLEGDLFDTIFIYQKFSTTETGESPLGRLLEEKATAEYAVSIELIPVENDAIKIQVSFKHDVLSDDQAVRLMDQFHSTLFDSIVNPDHDCRNFSFLDASHLSHIPAREERLKSPASLLHEFVQQSAEAFPERVAFEFATSMHASCIDKSTWTYKELSIEGNKIANLLLEHSVPQSSMVAICFEKCPEASFSILGILKAGCAYVPLDPTSPPARKQFILEDAACKVLLTTSNMIAELKDLSQSTIIAVDQALSLGELSLRSPRLERDISPDDLCYCLFTSGSTGTPKGCDITHDNVVQAMMAFQRLFKGHWSSQSRWLQFASFHFDVSVLEQYWSWSVGICVTSAPRDLLLEDLPGAIRKLGITHIDLTPSLARLVSPDDVPSLCQGVFITGGEQLREEVLESWGDQAVIYNGYGPTEATIGCTMYTRVPKTAKTSDIGPQFDNVGSFVLHPETREIVPRGAVGELCVSGPLVGRGYRKRVKMTNEKFEYREELGSRIYHTGDLVRLLHNDHFEFLTRVDDQVKLRGQRLEIGEINHVLRQSSAKIKEIATLVLKHPQQPKEQLVSFVAIGQLGERPEKPSLLASEQTKKLRQSLRNSAIERLAGYMVPTSFLILDSIPLSPNNKVDAKALKAFYNNLSVETLQATTRDNSSHRTSDSRTLQTILKVFQKINNKTEATPQSNFLELGLDSISAISFSRALKSEGLEISPTMVMKYPTVESLAFGLSDNSFRDSLRNAQHRARQRIRAFAHRHLSSVSQRLQLGPEELEQLSPCTPLQEGIILKTIQESKPLYFSLFVFSLNRPLDMEAMQRSWDEVTQENQILRTRFVATDDGYAQVVMRNYTEAHVSQRTRPKGTDLWSWVKSEHAEWSQGLQTLEKKLWNVWVAESKTRPIMCLEIFHALYDGISLSNLLNDVASIYRGRSTHVKRPRYHEMLPFGPLLQIDGSKEHWTAQLHRTRLLGLESIPDPGSSTVTVSSNFARADTIQTLRSRLNVTEPAIFLACWLLALQKHFQLMPTVGLVLSGRTLDVEEAEQVTGPMFNTIPCHVDPDDGCSISDFIIKCHAYNVASMQYQHTPLRDITKWYNSKSNSILFDSIFVFQKQAEEDESYQKSWSLAFSDSSIEYPLAVEIEQERYGGVSVTLVAKAVGISHSGASQLASYVEDFFNKSVTNPDYVVPISDDSRLSTSTSLSGTYRRPESNENEAPFAWSEISLSIRKEIAILADLEVEGVSADASVMEFGLDSIDAIRLSARLKKTGITLSVSQIVRDRTIRRMAASASSSMFSPITNNEGAHALQFNEIINQLRSSLENQGIDVNAYEEILPATSLQDGMIANMLSSDFEEYYNHDILELDPTMDLSTLQAAWDHVIRNNAILRTKFLQIDDPRSPFAFAQAVFSPSPLEWDTVEISAESEVHTVIEQIKEDVQEAGLKGQMFRLTPVFCGPKHYVIMTAAHALFDGWSMDLIHADVSRLCSGGHIQDHQSYRTTLEHILITPAADASHFWSSQLSGLSSTVIPTAGQATSHIVRQEIKSKYQASRLLSFCRKHGVTPQTVGILCWTLTLAWHAKQLDVCFGLVLSGRGTEEEENTIFPLMNTVLFRSVLHGTPTEVLQYIQDVNAKITDYQSYPLSKAMKINGRSSDNLFNTLFIYQKRPTNALEHPFPYKSVGGTSKTQFPVNVELEVSGEEVIWRVALAESLAKNRFLESIETVLKSVIERPNQDIYKIANGSIFICELPPFAQGYVDQAQENEKATRRGVDASDNDTPWTEYEQAVRSALSSTADIPESDITRSSNLFHLGLDSISAIKVSALLRKKSLKLAVSDMLRAATVKEMAKRVQSVSAIPHSRSNGYASTLSERMEQMFPWQRAGVKPVDVECILPATSFQSYTLLMCQKSEGRLFGSSFTYTLSRKVSPQSLQSAWDSLIRKFPILRTFFLSTGKGNPTFFQVVLRKTYNPITWVKGGQQSKKPLSTQPVRLFARSNNDGMVIRLEIHHAIYDAVSLPMIISSFENHLNQASIPNDLEHEFEPYLRNIGIGLSNTRQREFWTAYLEGASKPAASDVVDRHFAANKLELFVQDLMADTSQFEKRARKEGLGAQSLFTATLAIVLQGILPERSSTSTKEVVLGVYLANRSLDVENISQLAAPTVNIVPLRVKFRRDGSILNIARQIQADLGEISRAEHCGVALHDIAQWTGVKIDCNINFLKLPEVQGSASDRNSTISLSRAEELGQDIWPMSKSYDRGWGSIQPVPSTIADAYIVDFVTYKSDGPSHREHAVRRRYHLQHPLDYSKYNTLCGSLRQLAHKLADLDPADPYRIETETALLEKLWSMGVLKQSRSQGSGLSSVEKDVTVSAFARRRLPVVMVRTGMVETIQAATKFIEQGHVRCGTQVVEDPAFLVTRGMEDFVTWVDSSKIKRNVLKYREQLDDFDLL